MTRSSGESYDKESSTGSLKKEKNGGNSHYKELKERMVIMNLNLGMFRSMEKRE